MAGKNEEELDRGRHPVRNQHGLLQRDRSRSDYPTLAERCKVAAFDGINRLGIFEPDPAEIRQTGITVAGR
jgi:hypothetical protein